MALQLNREQPKVEAHKDFYGRNVDQMPILLSGKDPEGRVIDVPRIPESAAMIMENRINDSDACPDWGNVYWDTSDLLPYSSKKQGDKVKFVLSVDAENKITETGRRVLGLINPNSKRDSYGAIVLTDDVYDSIKGPGVIEVKRSDIGKLETLLTPEQIAEHKGWRILARHPQEVPKEFAKDEKLLPNYASWVKTKTGQDTNMGFYPDSNESYAKLRAVYVDRPGRLSGSDVDGGTGLDCDSGRFAGLAPEALCRKKFRQFRHSS